MRIIDGGHAEIAGADADDIKEPEELSEVEQEARQTGETVEEVVAKKTKAPKKAVKKAKAEPKKAPKAKKSAKAPKAAKPKKTASIGKPRAKTASGGGATGKPKKAAKKYIRKGEKDGSASKRGPKGLAEPKRNAKDNGVFGRKVDRARKEKGWTQSVLALKCEITQPAICNIIKGTAGASEKTTAKLSKLLGIK
jgi:ribosome-binding protein aMBF1 (putative translation factor)